MSQDVARLPKIQLGVRRGLEFADRYPDPGTALGAAPPPTSPLGEYFTDYHEGPGIWKWTHYFEIYDRHFSRFRERPVNVLEIGVFSGGSLGMWRSYFGERCQVYGVDIDPDCRRHEGDGVEVFIGDQADRGFWKEFRRNTPPIDILIDDGGHEPEQQIVTLEEMLPHMPPGSVYLCEDVAGKCNEFAAYAAGLVMRLNTFQSIESAELSAEPTSIQRSLHSIHFYPYVCVIEKHVSRPARFAAPKHGSDWLVPEEPET